MNNPNPDSIEAVVAEMRDVAYQRQNKMVSSKRLTLYADRLSAISMAEPVAWLTHDEEGEPAMLFFDRSEAKQYSEDDEDPLYRYPRSPKPIAPITRLLEDDLNAALGKSDESYATWDIAEIIAALQSLGVSIK